MPAIFIIITFTTRGVRIVIFEKYEYNQAYRRKSINRTYLLCN
ncbi:hypothetical protein KL86DYS2_11651 [uncultured Dysgonomonas sp.]|uniref:Uncharacterized protein n=1 Tax=uncultured Dysgonomonas sp. TaxID=206096 RepID=A0A212JIZ5_9BACT|nr:hypothetical protein KL86DYS2_11651 [uncultured Dysgonomonas sp.]